MKQCSKCKELKQNEEFYIKNKKTGTLQSVCKLCNKEVSRKHYLEHTEKVKQSSRNSKAKNIPHLQKFIIDWLLKNPCSCGENNVLFLEFHHKNRLTKEYNVSTLLTYSKEKLEAEINKCQVLCVKCHRLLTHKENNTYKWKYLQNISS